MLVQHSVLSPRPALLDLPSQQALATYLSGSPASHHIDLCSDTIAPITAELAYHIALAFVQRNKGQECRGIFESFFGGPMPLPKPGTPPDTIYTSSLQLRARAYRSGGHCGSTGLDKELEDRFKAISAATLTRLVCCRAEAATLLDELDAPRWWLTAMSLYDTFLPNQRPSSRLERICAFDLYRYRDE